MLGAITNFVAEHGLENILRILAATAQVIAYATAFIWYKTSEHQPNDSVDMGDLDPW